jgi:peroxiredoxin
MYANAEMRYRSHMTSKRLILLATVALLAVAAWFIYPIAQHKIADEIRLSRIPTLHKKAPSFSLKDSAGRTVQLADYRGKVVLLNFWATWCGPCRIEIPWFVDFQKTYASQGFTVLGISLDDDGWTAIDPWLKEQAQQGKPVTYPILLGNAGLYGGMDALPTSYVIDRDGKIEAIHTGLVSKSVYADEIVKLLATPKTAGLN